MTMQETDPVKFLAAVEKNPSSSPEGMPGFRLRVEARALHSAMAGGFVWI